MKIAITGHTGSIGKSIFDFYSVEHTVIGFSRSNGYDITDPKSVDSIMTESADCEIFINIAYDKTGQIDLSKRWFELNKHKNYLLLSIGSIATVAENYINENLVFKKYTADKNELERMNWEINFSNCNAKSIIVAPGVVDTPMAHPALIEKFRKENSLISANEVRDVVVQLIDNFYSKNWFIPLVYMANRSNINQ